MTIFILQLISLICLGAALVIVLVFLTEEPADAQPEAIFLRIHRFPVHRCGPAMGIAETANSLQPSS